MFQLLKDCFVESEILLKVKYWRIWNGDIEQNSVTFSIIAPIIILTKLL